MVISKRSTDGPEFAPQCAGMLCSPEHSMTAMACIRALLVSVLLIRMIRSVVAWKLMRNSIAPPWAPRLLARSWHPHLFRFSASIEPDSACSGATRKGTLPRSGHLESALPTDNER
jgi:hypothetical protein